MNEKNLRVIELFSGVGSQTQALKNIGVPHRVVAVSDIDPYADKSYRALHGAADNLGDIQKIAALPEADLWTYSFPCTDIAVCGRKLGLYGTRSGLLWEVKRLLETAAKSGTLPKFLLLENVKNLVKGFKADFDIWLAFLSSLGYRNFWSVVNAKAYIPQNRERVFCVSILDGQAVYEFPAPPARTTKLKDYLDAEVDGRYYLKIGAAEGVLKTGFHSQRRKVQTKDCSGALLARDSNDPVYVIGGNISGMLGLKDMPDTAADEQYRLKIGALESVLRPKRECGKRTVRTKDCCHAFTARDGRYPACAVAGGLESAVWDMLVRLTDVEHGGIPLPARDEPIIVAQRGRYAEDADGTKQRLEYNRDGVCNTLTTVCKDNLVCTVEWDAPETYTLEDIFKGLRIRKMTEREYWRLMG
jgi:DNA (cytosine-5)-methyltransferase 1